MSPKVHQGTTDVHGEAISDAYAAGALDAAGEVLFDGAGRLLVRVVSHDEATLQLLRSHTGLGRVVLAKTGSATPLYHWVISRDELGAMLTRLGPHLRRLREPAEHAVAHELRPARPCARPGCERPVKALEMCATHYRAWRRARLALELTEAQWEVALVLYREGAELRRAAAMAVLAAPSPD